MADYVSAKDPKNVEPYFFIFCDKKTGLNDASASDNGDLQGATISTITSVTAASGLTVDSSNKDAVSIKPDLNTAPVSYGASTVVTAWLSGGTDGVEYEIECLIVTSDSRTLTKTMIVPVRQL